MRPLLVPVLALCLAVGFAVPAAGASSLVPEQARIPEALARLELARLLAGAKRLQEAAANYRRLLELRPDDPQAALELAGVELRLGRPRQAEALLAPLVAARPLDVRARLLLGAALLEMGEEGRARSVVGAVEAVDLDDPKLLAELADLQAALGHGARSRELYQRALSLAPDDEALRLRLAQRMVNWGEFYGAQAIFNERLAQGFSAGVALDLADSLLAAQRYERAASVVRRVLAENPGDNDALLLYARILLAEAKPAAAVTVLEGMDDPPAAVLGRALLRAGRLDEARRVLARAAVREPADPQVLLELGRVQERLGDQNAARTAWRRAAADKGGAAAAYLAAGPERGEEAFVSALAANEASPARLTDWAGIYAANGEYEASLVLLRAALARDPNYLPARLLSAEVPAYQARYDLALARLDDLLLDYPFSSRIRRTRARVLGWSKRFDAAREAYDDLLARAPDDAGARRETARRAFWAKRPEEAQQAYAAIWRDPVDDTLRFRIDDLALAGPSRRELAERLDNDVPHDGFEYLADAPDRAYPLPGERAGEAAALGGLWDEYAVQKRAWLEHEAKDLAWNTRFTPSLDAYYRLTDFEPANREAWFDKAQVECALGLCNAEAESYARLLELDPNHALAKRALQRVQLRDNIAAGADYSYWHEEGRGDLARIARHKVSVGGRVPLSCGLGVSLAPTYWLERPTRHGSEVSALGQTLGFDGVFGPYLRAEASWTHKDYQREGYADRDTGRVRLEANLRDYARVGGFYERTDEIYNAFGLAQGVQADRFGLDFSSRPVRRLEIRAMAQKIVYSDNNEGNMQNAAVGWDITDHPRTLRIVLDGEHRQTRRESRSIFSRGELVDIEHPYWTPQEYYGGGATLEWRHDLAEFFFCGARRHYYDIRLGVGTDTEHNPGVQLEAEWVADLTERFSVRVAGLIHRSKEWDAEGAWLSLDYVFGEGP